MKLFYGFVWNLPVVQAHALNAGTNTNVDHASLDLVGNIDAGLETRGALSVEGSDGGGLREAGDQGGGSHFSGTTTGGQDGADADILHEGRVDLGSVNDGFEDTGHEVGGGGVFEATLTTLGEGASACGGDDDLD